MEKIMDFIVDGGMATTIFVLLVGIIIAIFTGGTLGNIIVNISQNILG